MDLIETGKNMVGRFFVLVALVIAGIGIIQNEALSAVDISNSQAFSYTDTNGNTLLYRLFFPPGHDTPGQSFPLVTFLHGSGEIGDDNLAQVDRHIDGLIEATRSNEHAAFLLAPQLQPGQGIWSNIAHPTELSLGSDLLMQVIDQLEQNYQIDTTRRSITGLSLGGYGTWDIAAKRPDMFAAAAPMSGGGDPDKADILKNVPIWNFHGYHDSNVDHSRNVIAAIEEAGGAPLYLETGGYHDIWSPIYDDPHGELYSWMIDGVTPSLATVTYDPVSGSLKLDTSQAPGGTIDFFLLRTFDLFSLQPTMSVNGETVATLDFVSNTNDNRLTFNDTFADSFSGVADFGPILPSGLSRQELYGFLARHWYRSPDTGDGSRTFRLLMAVPEPSTLLLGATGIVGLLAITRNTRRVF